MDLSQQVKHEYEEIRERFQSMNFSSFLKGDWLASYVTRVLETHANPTTASRIQDRYEGDTPEEQAQHAIERAAKSCAAAGRLTASLACAAELSFVPTFGFSFPGIGAAVGLAVMSDIGYCLRTHIQSIYDLSVIYGAPLTLDDVEDCYLIFLNAMALNVEEIGGGVGKLLSRKKSPRRVVTYNARYIVRMGLRSFFQQLTQHGRGNRLVRKLVERVNLRLAVPGVNVAIAGNFNRRFTRHVLHIAEQHMRWRGAVVQPLFDLYDRAPDLDPLWVFRGIIVVVESGSAAEWNRHQLDALRYCQTMLELTDADLASLDSWFDENLYSFLAQLPPISQDAASYFVELLIVVTAMYPDTRHDAVFAQSITAIAQTLNLPVNAVGIARDIGTMRGSYG